jgi:hypothetical protein
VYQNFCKLLKVNPTEVTAIEKIPFLPIEFFKTQQVICGKEKAEVVFLSSGTTGQYQSKHLVKDVSVYVESFTKGFEQFYGKIEEYCFLALLPSYMEREGSSLIYMTEYLVKHSKHPLSGFYLDNYAELIKTIEKLKQQKQSNYINRRFVCFARFSRTTSTRFVRHHHCGNWGHERTTKGDD